MSSRFTEYVWAKPAPVGNARLLLLAMAENADRRGRCSVPLRDLATMCAVSKALVSQLVKSLIDAGHIRRLGQRGKMTNVVVYQIVADESSPGLVIYTSAAQEVVTKMADPNEIQVNVGRADVPAEPTVVQPEPQPPSVPIKNVHYSPDPITLGHPNNDVGHVLTAAGIPARQDQPMYWFRQEHQADLEALLKASGMSIGELCKALRSAPRPAGVCNRLTALLPMVEGVG